MKKHLIFLFAAMCMALITFAQAPALLNYQGVARNPVGNVLISKTISLRLSIHEGSANGTTVYSETRAVTTNAFGLFNIQIGSPGASATTGTVAGIDWGTGTKFIRVEADQNGGSNFVDMGASQLASVPYAMNAAGALPQGPAGGSLTGTYPNPTVANGAITAPMIAVGVIPTSLPPNGAAGGSLTGTYPDPTIANGAVTAPMIAAGVIPTTLPPSGAAGGSLTGTYPNPIVADGAITGPMIAAGVIPTSLPPGGTAGGSLTGTYPNPTIATGAVTSVMIAPGVIPTSLPPTGAAGGDLSGTYPSPVVSKLQARTVSATAPTAGQALVWNAVTSQWEPGTASGGAFVIPYADVENTATTLFSLTNDGDGTSLEGVNNTTSASIAAVRGIVTSTAPGGFSSAVRGINSGTGGLGIGVWGSQNGSGWGVYGVTPNGLGVYGNSSAAGTGVYANSNSGMGLQATSTNGIAANMSIFNNANNNNVLNASTLGGGNVIDVTTSGSGTGVLSSTAGGFAVHGITSTVSSAGIIGDNNGGGEAIVGRTTSNIAGAVVGRNDGGGYGVRGFIATNTDGTGVGVEGEVGNNGSTGSAGRFINANIDNTEANALEVETNGNGNIGDNTLGNAASFVVNNNNSVAGAVRGEVNTIFGNFGAAGIFGKSSGTGGFGGLFYASNTSGNGAGLVSLTDGNGNAITANAGKNGNGVEANIDGTGNALYGWVPSFGMGRAGKFDIFNTSNDNEAVTVTTVGNGTALSAKVNNNNGTSPALKGEVNSIFSNFGTAGVYGLSSGTGGFAGLFYSSNASGNGPALIALTEGNGNGITANAGKNGHGVEANCDGTGNAIYGWIPNFGGGKAARFANFNTGNNNPTVHITNVGTGNALLINHSGPSGNLALFQTAGTSVARIDRNGRGFFNNGTQNSGADVAETFAVEGNLQAYEPGDVLVISTSSDRTVEKSSAPYSTLVSGIYATKPGVLLTERNATEDDIADMVPMGVIGVIPTKVCLEGGAIKRGDMIVTSSQAGVAMKADLDRVKVGQVIGKALQDYNGTETGKINVLVSIK